MEKEGTVRRNHRKWLLDQASLSLPSALSLQNVSTEVVQTEHLEIHKWESVFWLRTAEHFEEWSQTLPLVTMMVDLSNVRRTQLNHLRGMMMVTDLVSLMQSRDEEKKHLNSFEFRGFCLILQLEMSAFGKRALQSWICYWLSSTYKLCLNEIFNDNGLIKTINEGLMI